MYHIINNMAMIYDTETSNKSVAAQRYNLEYNEKPLKNYQKDKLKFNRSMYDYESWRVFNRTIPHIEEYSRTEMYKDRGDMSEREELSAINKELLGFKNKFVSDCCSLGIPSSFVKKTKPYKEMCAITHSYSVYSKNSGHNPKNPKIYYKNAEPNLDTKHHINKFSHFKLKLRQLSACGARKIKNTPFLMCDYKTDAVRDSGKKEEPTVSNQ